ncbi:MAG TPA: hypothetical protein VHB79_13880 [Polyangiaceae bacterium]|nr:hypothetical protein [Polyangiaceae bacterium]
MKFVLSSLVASCALLLPVLAHAQELGEKGDLIFSADRLMGITANKVDYDVNPYFNNVFDNEWTSINFLWKQPTGPNTLDMPRLGIDYVALEHLTFGGSLAFSSIDPDRGGTVTAFLFEPRVGYMYSFNKTIGIWPRGGVTYHSLSEDGGWTWKALAFTAECPVTISPAQHFAFHIGPTFDIDMFGSVKNQPGQSVDVTMRSFGLNAGLLGWF